MKKGISLVALVITMVIMLLLASSVTVAGFGAFNNSKKIMFATEINMVQEACNSYKSENQGNFPVTDEIQLNISGVSSKARSQFANENVVSNTITLSKVDYSKLGITSLRYGTSAEGQEDIYVISKSTGKVYYAKGLKVPGNTYYTLTDELLQLLNLDSDMTIESNIIFATSETEWTSENVVTTVKVPKIYTGVTVSVLNKEGSYTRNESSSDTYARYVIDDIDSNYVVIVYYSYNGENYEKTFTVSNVDKTAPVLNLEKVSESVVKRKDSTTVTLILSDIEDSESGVKVIKYAPSYIEGNSDEIASYFKTNGYVAENNIIEMEDTTQYVTIYIEDNAGNFSAMYYSLSNDAYLATVVSTNSGVVTPAMINASLESYLGKTVTNYIAACSDADKEWQIFYSDGKNIYLISKDFLSYNNLDNEANDSEMPLLRNSAECGVRGASTYTATINLANALSVYSGNSDITSSNPAYTKLKFVQDYPTSTLNNTKVVNYLLDQSVWKKYIGAKASYALGGPTLEMLIDSYNSAGHETGPSKLYYSVGENGYSISSNNTDFTSYDISLSNGEYSSLYTLQNTKANGSFIASTSANGVNKVYVLAGNKLKDADYTDSYGIRPVVCLKAGVNLKLKGNVFVVE
ncbi:MAG: type II secretion system protein [Clostridia bacterium]|nr:type II secretion system protein [Clostridia bacterium]